MPTPYTGSPSGVHDPDPGPAPGRNPLLLIPDLAGPMNAESKAQALKTLADYAAYFINQLVPTTPLAPPYFGDGSDGSLFLSAGTTAISGVTKNYTDLTIGAGGILRSVRSIIRVNGTLTIDPAGLIHDNGQAGVIGAIGSFPVGVPGQGTDGIGGSVTALCPVGGGTSGGAGGSGDLSNTNPGVFATAGTSGTNFEISGNTLGLSRTTELAYAGLSAAGASGGKGAQGRFGENGGAGASGGCAASTSDDLLSTDLFAMTPLNVLATGMVRRTRFVNHGSGDKGAISEFVPIRGGGGGGGGGGAGTSHHGTGPPGGAGGAGGGVVMIFAKNVVLGSASCIQANGGNGSDGLPFADPAGGNFDSGGGGGGGGGRIVLIYSSITGSSLLAANCVRGGLGGNAHTDQGAAPGTTAGAGLLYLRKVG